MPYWGQRSQCWPHESLEDPATVAAKILQKGRDGSHEVHQGLQGVLGVGADQL